MFRINYCRSYELHLVARELTTVEGNTNTVSISNMRLFMATKVPLLKSLIYPDISQKSLFHKQICKQDSLICTSCSLKGIIQLCTVNHIVSLVNYLCSYSTVHMSVNNKQAALHTKAFLVLSYNIYKVFMNQQTVSTGEKIKHMVLRGILRAIPTPAWTIGKESLVWTLREHTMYLEFFYHTTTFQEVFRMISTIWPSWVTSTWVIIR